jgi:hypothetical protein
MALTPDQEAKLARLHRRATLYEAVMVNVKTDQRVLVGYTSNTRSRLLSMLNRHSAAVIKLAGTDLMQGTREHRAGVPLGMVIMGDWLIGFSGRTERQAIYEGELPWVGKAGA